MLQTTSINFTSLKVSILQSHEDFIFELTMHFYIFLIGIKSVYIFFLDSKLPALRPPKRVTEVEELKQIDEMIEEEIDGGN